MTEIERASAWMRFDQASCSLLLLASGSKVYLGVRPGGERLGWARSWHAWEKQASTLNSLLRRVPIASRP
jgi:hypothetical protein